MSGHGNFAAPLAEKTSRLDATGTRIQVLRFARRIALSVDILSLSFARRGTPAL
jgi:hypothetical protein